MSSNSIYSGMRAFFITLAIAVIGYLAYYFYITPDYTTGEKVYDFSWTADGQEYSLSALEGNYVLLDFWGSWCPPCRKENPELVKLYDRFGDQRNSQGVGFDMVSVGIETNERRWKAAIEKDGLRWPHHYTDLKRLKSPIAIEYGVKEIPTKFLINPKGVIILVNPTVEAVAELLSEKLD